MNQHIKDLIDFDARHEMFYKATRFVDYELIEGDILEFGVYTGRSLVLLSHFHEEFKKTIHGVNTPKRNVIGLDSFKGLMKNSHERWKEGAFKINHSYHPTIAKGELVTTDKVTAFFGACDLPAPIIIDGYFNEAGVTEAVNKVCKKVALIHIDCDLYDSTVHAFKLVKEKIQDGCIILFDDWFNFKASKNEGEQKAFYDFIQQNPQFEFIPYQSYVTFANSFILKVC